MFDLEKYELTQKGLNVKNIITAKEKLIPWSEIREVLYTSPYLYILKYNGHYCSFIFILKNGKEILIRHVVKEKAQTFFKMIGENLESEKLITTSEKFKNSIRIWWLESFFVILFFILFLIFLFSRYR